MRISAQVYLRWADVVLKQRQRTATDLEKDFCDGVNLCHLLEILTGQTIAGFPAKKNTTENVALALNFLADSVGFKSYGINVQDLEVSAAADETRRAQGPGVLQGPGFCRVQGSAGCAGRVGPTGGDPLRARVAIGRARDRLPTPLHTACVALSRSQDPAAVLTVHGKLGRRIPPERQQARPARHSLPAHQPLPSHADAVTRRRCVAHARLVCPEHRASSA